MYMCHESIGSLHNRIVRHFHLEDRHKTEILISYCDINLSETTRKNVGRDSIFVSIWN